MEVFKLRPDEPNWGLIRLLYFVSLHVWLHSVDVVRHYSVIKCKCIYFPIKTKMQRKKCFWSTPINVGKWITILLTWCTCSASWFQRLKLPMFWHNIMQYIIKVPLLGQYHAPFNNKNNSTLSWACMVQKKHLIFNFILQESDHS